MKQRRSFTKLLYHLVFSTKGRGHFLSQREDLEVLRGLFAAKARELDARLEEVGGWREHVHLLVRARPTMALSELYRHLKGFSSRAWHLRFPERPFAWSDGVYAATVDPDDHAEIRSYVRCQWQRHETRSILPRWEPDAND